MSLRFPFDLPSRQALVELIRRDRPSEELLDDYVLFEDMYFSPSEEEPGRTYIEMTNLRTGKKRPFLFRRLDIAQILREYTAEDEPFVRIELDGTITSAKVVAEINRKFNMHLNHDDVEVSYQPMTKHNATVYTLIMLGTSFAYYGWVPIYVNTTPEELGLRLLEDGTVRLLENGITRRLENQ
jgi:hypothetical protein